MAHKVISAAKKAVGAVLNAPKTFVNSVEKKLEGVRKAKAVKEVADIERAFGSVENYRRLDPMFRTMQEKEILMKKKTSR